VIIFYSQIIPVLLAQLHKNKFTIGPAKNIIAIQIRAWMIIVFHDFTLSSSSAAVSILNQPYSQYSTATKYKNHSRYSV